MGVVADEVGGGEEEGGKTDAVIVFFWRVYLSVNCVHGRLLIDLALI